MSFRARGRGAVRGGSDRGRGGGRGAPRGRGVSRGRGTAPRGRGPRVPRGGRGGRGGRSEEPEKVVTSAIIVKPPESLWPQIQAIREKYDKAYSRWMPHINLIYPFVPEDKFKEVYPQINEALAKVEPFTVRLEQFSHFDFGSSATVYLKPEPSHALKHLQSVLEGLFPFCNELSTKSKDGFHPHLTVGQVPSTYSSAISFISELSAQFSGILDWKIDEVCIISRVGEKPFVVKHCIKLRGQPKLYDDSLPATTAPSEVVSAPKETPPHFPYSPDSSLPRILKSIKKWINNPNHRHHLPKTKESFLKAILPFCNVRLKILEEDYVIKKLVSENFIEVDEDSDVFLVDRKFAGFPPSGNKLPYHYTHDFKEEQVLVLQKCFEWVSNLSYPPNSVENLKSSLSQLCYYTFNISCPIVVEQLCAKKIIAFEESKIVYSQNNV